MLDVRRLRLLREVATHGSIAGAARTLSFTPSAVSQQLTKLERETGVTLLDRGPQSVRLTEAGRMLAGHATEILERLAVAEAELRALAPPDARPLRLLTFGTAGAALVPTALDHFSERRPDTSVTVAALDPIPALACVAGGEADLAVVFEYPYVPLPARPGVELELLLEEDLLVLLPRAHPAARAPEVVLADLADETWIKSTPKSSCSPFTERACRAAGFTPHVKFEFDDYQSLQSLVASGLGVAFAPRMGLRPAQRGVVARPVASNPPRRRILAARREGDTEPGLEIMLDSLRESAGAYARRARLRAVDARQ
jgi:DNA-binding transcriptional LysR family regulator